MDNPTSRLRARVEEAGFQFLKDRGSWALFDCDDRSEVGGTRCGSLGDSIWTAAQLLGIEEE